MELKNCAGRLWVKRAIKTQSTAVLVKVGGLQSSVSLGTRSFLKLKTSESMLKKQVGFPNASVMIEDDDSAIHLDQCDSPLLSTCLGDI